MRVWIQLSIVHLYEARLIYERDKYFLISVFLFAFSRFRRHFLYLRRQRKLKKNAMGNTGRMKISSLFGNVACGDLFKITICKIAGFLWTELLQIFKGVLLKKVWDFRWKMIGSKITHIKKIMVWSFFFLQTFDAKNPIESLKLLNTLSAYKICPKK